jgi:outer membrane receptor for ferrienterochelin and colicins
LIEQTDRNYDNLIWRASTIYDHKFLKRHSNIVGAEVYSEQLLSFMFVSDGASVKKNAQNYSVFAQQEWALSEKVTLVSGVRFDYHSQFKGFPTFRLSTMYKINPYITLRGGYSGGFRSPTLKELYTDWFHPYGGGFQIIGNKNMKAEKSHNFNLSTDFSYKRLDITLMGQYSYINKKIDLFWLSNDTIQYQNSGNANVTSAELSIAYRFKFNLKLAASYSYVVQLPAKRSIVRPHNITFTADYTPKFIKKYAPTLSINGKFYSSMTIFGTVDLSDDKNTTGVDSNTEEYRINYEPYMIWRLTLSVPLPFHFVIGAGINNLFNYQTKFSSFYSNTTSGRTYYVSLKWNFNLKNREK